MRRVMSREEIFIYKFVVSNTNNCVSVELWSRCADEKEILLSQKPVRYRVCYGLNKVTGRFTMNYSNTRRFVYF